MLNTEGDELKRKLREPSKEFQQYYNSFLVK